MSKLDNYTSHIAMVRLVRELSGWLSDRNDMPAETQINIDNIVNGFLKQLPKKVSEELRHG